MPRDPEEHLMSNMIPIVASADELDSAIRFATMKPTARWYVAERARVLGRPEAIPEDWNMPVVAASGEMTRTPDLTPEEDEKVKKAVADGTEGKLPEDVRDPDHDGDDDLVAADDTDHDGAAYRKKLGLTADAEVPEIARVDSLDGIEIVTASVDYEDFGDDGGALVATAFTDEQRSKLADSGAAMPDGSFPIRNRTDLQHALRAVGRAKNSAAAKRHIKKRAKKLGLADALPDDYKAITASADEVVSDFKGALRSRVEPVLAAAHEDERSSLRARVSDDPIVATSLPDRLKQARGAFEEALHPRGKDGKFITVGGRVMVDTGEGNKLEGTVKSIDKEGVHVLPDGSHSTTFTFKPSQITNAPAAEAHIGAPEAQTPVRLTGHQSINLRTGKVTDPDAPKTANETQKASHAADLASTQAKSENTIPTHIAAGDAHTHAATVAQSAGDTRGAAIHQKAATSHYDAAKDVNTANDKAALKAIQRDRVAKMAAEHASGPEAKPKEGADAKALLDEGVESHYEGTADRDTEGVIGNHRSLADDFKKAANHPDTTPEQRQKLGDMLHDVTDREEDSFGYADLEEDGHSAKEAKRLTEEHAATMQRSHAIADEIKGTTPKSESESGYTDKMKAARDASSVADNNGGPTTPEAHKAAAEAHRAAAASTGDKKLEAFHNDTAAMHERIAAEPGMEKGWKAGLRERMAAHGSKEPSKHDEAVNELRDQIKTSPHIEKRAGSTPGSVSFHDTKTGVTSPEYSAKDLRGNYYGPLDQGGTKVHGVHENGDLTLQHRAGTARYKMEGSKFAGESEIQKKGTLGGELSEGRGLGILPSLMHDSDAPLADKPGKTPMLGGEQTEHEAALHGIAKSFENKGIGLGTDHHAKIDAILKNSDKVDAHKQLASLMSDAKLGGKQRARYREALNAHHAQRDGGKVTGQLSTGSNRPASSLREDNELKGRLAAKEVQRSAEPQYSARGQRQFPARNSADTNPFTGPKLKTKDEIKAANDAKHAAATAKLAERKPDATTGKVEAPKAGDINPANGLPYRSRDLPPRPLKDIVGDIQKAQTALNVAQQHRSPSEVSKASRRLEDLRLERNRHPDATISAVARRAEDARNQTGAQQIDRAVQMFGSDRSKWSLTNLRIAAAAGDGLAVTELEKRGKR